MKVREAMHKGAEWVTPETPVTQIAQKMRNLDIGCLPVGQNDRLVGMVTDRDIICRGLADSSNPSKLTAENVMTRGIVYCNAEEDLEDALHLMEEKQIRRLPVIDDNKRMVGMLSLGDISHSVARELSGEVVCSVSAHHS